MKRVNCPYFPNVSVAVARSADLIACTVCAPPYVYINALCCVSAPCNLYIYRYIDGRDVISISLDSLVYLINVYNLYDVMLSFVYLMFVPCINLHSLCSVSVSVCRLSVCLSVCPSVCLPVCLSVCLSVSYSCQWKAQPIP